VLREANNQCPGALPTGRVTASGRLEAVRTRVDSKDGAEMVWVPEGEFVMGGNERY
jgi:formylglycine-generating enzyme required for sulfatase activity